MKRLLRRPHKRRSIPSLLIVIGALVFVFVLTIFTKPGHLFLALPSMQTAPIVGNSVSSSPHSKEGGGEIEGREEELTSEGSVGQGAGGVDARAGGGDNAESATGEGKREMAIAGKGEEANSDAYAKDNGPSSTSFPRPASWRREFGANPHFSLDPSIMPDAFLSHLQYMSSKIASKSRWEGNGWSRFEKRDISRCGESFVETPALNDDSDEVTIANSYLSRGAGADIVGLPECQMWRAIHPEPWVEKGQKKGKKGENGDGELVAPVPLTKAELDRPYRKCCVEHARLRDTAFFVFDQLEANNITYFLSTGTALGALRHNGTIIPWDTDVDISIYPRDAEKSRALFKGLSSYGKNKKEGQGKKNSKKNVRADSDGDEGGGGGDEDAAAAVAEKPRSGSGHKRVATPVVDSIARMLNQTEDSMSLFLKLSLKRHFFSPDPQGKPMFWVHGSRDGFPRGGPHVEIFHDAVYTDYPESLLPLVKCSFYGRLVNCPNPKMFKVWFPSGSDVYGGGHYHGKSRCTIYIKGVKHETDKC